MDHSANQPALLLKLRRHAFSKQPVPADGPILEQLPIPLSPSAIQPMRSVITPLKVPPGS